MSLLGRICIYVAVSQIGNRLGPKEWNIVFVLHYYGPTELLKTGFGNHLGYNNTII